MTQKNDIKLTVVVLVYNTAEFLPQCFDSILNQTLKGIEIIAVDDESPDNSLEICHDYEAKYDNFRVITQKNQGGAVAGTTGMKEAKGKYIALVDSDDFLALNAYEVLYTMCEENSADIAIGKPLRYLNERELEVILPEEQAVWEEKKVIDSFAEVPTLFHDKFYWNKIFRREFVEQHEIYMPAGYLYADFLMTHKAYEFAKKIVITNDVVYFWRRHDAKRIIKSASQEIASCANFQERTKSLLFEQSNNLETKAKFDSIKLLLLSFVFHNIINEGIFRKTFLSETKKVLATIEHIEVFDLHPIIKLRLWLIKHNQINNFFYTLGKPLKKTLEVKDEKVYCKLPFFQNEDFNIPNEIYEYKSLRPEMIKNFLYVDNGNSFTFQVLLHHVSLLPESNYYIFFKDNKGTTKYKYKLNNNVDYYSCEVTKKQLFQNYDKLYLGIGNDSNIVYRINKNNSEPAFDISKKLSYIVRYSWDKKEVYFTKRDIAKTIQNKISSI